MSGAPRLLYLAHGFPPAPPIGAVRAWNAARTLTGLGWSVTVVTPAPEVWLSPNEPELIEREVREAGVRRILTGHGWPMLLPESLRWREGRASRLAGGACRVAARRLGLDNGFGWAGSVEDACADLRKGDFDLVLATGGPFISFRVARRLARRLSCPFVMDYRDPWTGNPHGPARPSAATAREEAGLLRDCALATVVSPSWAALIGESFGVREKLRVVTNGFDPATFARVEAERFDHFALVYAGTLYPPKRVLDPVLRALAAYARRPGARPAKLHYYGDYGDPVRQAAANCGASSLVVVHGRVPRADALRAQKGAGLLVVVASVEPEGSLADRGVVTGKVFDCMALGRPALVVAPRGSDLYGIADTAGGMRCFTGADEAGMTRCLAEAAEGRAPVPRRPAAYRWDAIGRDLDRALREVLAS